MATELCADLLQTANVPQATRNATQWLKEQAQLTSMSRNLANPKTILANHTERLIAKPLIGRMYLFAYDPKYKEELPYYDKFPLVFPFRSAGQGFYGINMHYLPHMLRARLMDALYPLVNNTKQDDTTKLRISYNILAGASKYKYFKPCVKHYLNSHLKSRFLWIPADQWNTALFLPLERFVGATRQQVFTDSRRMVR